MSYEMSANSLSLNISRNDSEIRKTREQLLDAWAKGQGVREMCCLFVSILSSITEHEEKARAYI